jgi:hypothetical protein
MTSWRLRLVARLAPLVRRRVIVELFRSTAAAFECNRVRLDGLSPEECLLAYAVFTADRAEAALRRGDGLAELQGRLARNAYGLARARARLLGVRRVDDVMALARLLYGMLDIDFAGCASGEITIHSCYFSPFYSPAVCRLMSALDCGLLAGLAGGGELEFTERITEGRPCCRARFTLGADRAGPRSSTRPARDALSRLRSRTPEGANR